MTLFSGGPSTQLPTLQAARTITDLASLLGFRANAVSYLLYKLRDDTRYTKFEIPKKAGGVREISAPRPSLKLLQNRLAVLLQDCLIELAKDSKPRKPISYAFSPKIGIVDNAQRHRGRRYVFNLDLADFFGSIHFGRIVGFFIKDKRFGLTPEIATIIANIACCDHKLPQGSPCSPIISNLIAHMLDFKLARLAHKHGCVYTRYADDLTFSTNLRGFPAAIAAEFPEKRYWEPGMELTKIIEASGFKINDNKTRMQYTDSRQEVTGLLVNRKVNVRPEYRHRVRAMVHRMFTKGEFYLPAGPVVATQLPAPDAPIIGSPNQLQGMLSFIHQIDHFQTKLMDENPFNYHPVTYESRLKRNLVFIRFLFYQNFYKADRPVIICEGKTDNVYLRSAIRSLSQTFPSLAAIKDGKVEMKVRILRYTGKLIGELFGNKSGGTGGLATMMRTYLTESKKFQSGGGIQPVIFVIDNDEGSKSIFGSIASLRGDGKKKKDRRREKTKTVAAGAVVEKPTVDADKKTGTQFELEEFVHVLREVYVVATPRTKTNEDTCIEDLFQQETLNIPLEGKTFRRDLETESKAHFGKADFAFKVVQVKASTIDFSGFSPLLERIEKVIAHQAERLTEAANANPAATVPTATP